MRALITRPRDDAERVALPLRERGIDIVFEPLLVIHVRGSDRRPFWRRDPLKSDLAKAQGLIFSSANGVRAFAAASKERRLPVYAVGDLTARVAREVGFTQVHSAEGDVVALGEMIRRLAQPSRGPLVHAAGSKVAGDLPGALAPAGFEIRRHVLYEALPARALSPETVRAFQAGTLDAVLLFSPRTAATFATLVRDAGLTGVLSKVTVYALSPAVAQALGDLSFHAVRVAAEPTQESLLAALDADRAPSPPPPSLIRNRPSMGDSRS
ncbi:uroporphyrinogen-III synthase [Pararhodospirillum photometricum]|nr:uroporphyrinogen-III synthase [Pararhodospirillum photometricum]